MSFSEREVNKCKRDRAAARHTEVQCPRCQKRYWIRAGQIAAAVRRNGRPSTNGASRSNGSSPPVTRKGRKELTTAFPRHAVLKKAGVKTLEELAALDDYESIPGIGPSGAREIQKALDRERATA